MKKISQWVAYVLGLGLIPLSIWVFFFKAPDLQDAFANWYLLLMVFVTGAFSFYLAGNKGYKAPIRTAWFFFGLAFLADLIAEGLWFYFSRIGIDPFPSIADFFYLLYYVFIFVGILSLPYQPVDNRRKVLVSLDILVVLLAGCLFLYYFILSPMNSSLTGYALSEAIMALAYPVADLFILAALLSLLQRDTERVDRKVLVFLSSSLIVTIIADLIWAVGEVRQWGDLTIYLNVLWILAIWFHYWAALKQYKSVNIKASEPDAFRPLLRDILIYAAPAASFLLLLFSSGDFNSSNPRHYVVTIFSVILGVTVMLRQYLILRENRHLYEEMEDLAIHDALTELLNRRAFDQALEREIVRAERFGHALSLLVMDLDGFKQYNDTYGHLGGDMILKRIAKTLRSKIRSVDLVARYGGDEFVVILPEADLESARMISRRLQESIKAGFLAEGISITIGCSTLSEGMGKEELINIADQELYALKSSRG